jgi:hypothetical protein
MLKEALRHPGHKTITIPAKELLKMLSKVSIYKIK